MKGDAAEGRFTYFLSARGVFRHKGQTPLVGDLATVRIELDENGVLDRERGILMAELLDRKNELIRPPLANLDYMLITAAAAKPDPSYIAIDKLTCASVSKNVTPIIIIKQKRACTRKGRRDERCIHLCRLPCFHGLSKGKMGRG